MVPFVVRSGGCTEWSNIGSSGFAIHLKHHSAVELDVKSRTATNRGGIPQAEIATRLTEQDLFTDEEQSHLI